MSDTGWAGLAALSAAVFAGLGTLLGMLLKSRRETHADSVRDYKEMYLTVQKERADDRLAWRKEVHDLRDDWNRDKLEAQKAAMSRELELKQARDDDNRRCDDRLAQMAAEILRLEREKGAMAADIRGLQAELRHLESFTGAGPIVPQPGVVIAGIDGIVELYAPSLSAFLGWRPDDVQGQSIHTFIAESDWQRCEAAIVAVAEERTRIDPSKGISGHARHKEGRDVAVTVYLDGRMLKKSGLIVATIQERPAVMAQSP